MNRHRSAKGRGFTTAVAGLIGCGLLLGVPARGEDPVEPGRSNGQPSIDLSTKYRFIERYTFPGARPDPLSIGQYRVGIRETIERVGRRPKGAPDLAQEARQIIFSERAARVLETGEVTDTIRRYTTYRKDPDPYKSTEGRPLEGLTLWYHAGGGVDPRMICLTEGRRLHEMEYGVASRQIFLPDLRALLPPLPSLVGDTWKVPKQAIVAMLREKPEGGEGLTGKLQAVRKSADGKQLLAVINVSGRLVFPMPGELSRETGVNGELLFAFTPTAEASAAGGAGRNAIVNARGAIVELRVALKSVLRSPDDPDGRLKVIVNHVIDLRRKPVDSEAELLVPNPPPAPTEANSWLTFEDVDGRFHFNHPQSLKFQTLQPGDPTVVLLGPLGSVDSVSLILQEKTGKSEEDRQFRDPGSHRKILKSQLEEDGFEIIPGPEGWLPEANWADAKMKVYRSEAVLRPPDDGGIKSVRIYFDFYLALLAHDECLVFTARTAQDPPTAFRSQAEQIVRSFKLGLPPRAK